ncbi:MAG: transcriptional regulator, PadR family [Thermoleophilia bacterium]|nr:transcriptional regulator, PadR family [Thermoleophilia bacterium]
MCQHHDHGGHHLHPGSAALGERLRHAGHGDAHAALHARMHHGPHMHGPGGFGGPGGGFGGPGGFGGRGRGPARRRRRGETRTALLRLLAEEPRHGYALMQELERRSEGRWSPSAGSVYPTLEQLADEGLVRAEEADGRRSYSLTDAGREAVAASADEPAPWEPVGDEELDPHRRLGRATMLVAAAAQQVAHAGSASQQEAALVILEEARRSMYTLLAGGPEDEAG